MVAGRGIAQLLTGGQNVAIQPGRFAFASDFFLRLPFPITITFVALMAAIVLTRATGLGLFIESVGNNPRASRYTGINTRLVILCAYILCGIFSGVAGLIVTSDIKQADASNNGLYMELDAILAVVIGGTSLLGGRYSLVGSVIGAILIQTLTTTILTRGIPAPVTMVVKAVVIIGVCLLQAPKFRQMVRIRFKT
jgi:simple sugar transport system permease protein